MIVSVYSVILGQSFYFDDEKTKKVFNFKSKKNKSSNKKEPYFKMKTGY